MVREGTVPGRRPGPEQGADGGPEAERVAIIGMACRYPGGVHAPDDLWQVVVDGRETVAPLPADRGWDLSALHGQAPGRPGPIDVERGGFLDDAAEFDAAFFGLTPSEAQQADPQRRLMLETCWEAFERAGLDPEDLRGSAIGVFVGAAPSGYGTATGDLSAQLAAAYDLEGPVATGAAARSSSLAALHLAGEALRAGECTLALAGGVTVHATPDLFLRAGRPQELAPDGRCKAFSAAADGMGAAEGAGVLLLERLSDARRNGHPVLAVVRGSAARQDLPSGEPVTPDGPAQQQLILGALAAAGVGPGEVDAVEAHGAGTALGDEVEARALIATYGAGRAENRPLWLGTVTSHLGHTQRAAGVAGVIRMVQALRHGTLPRALHAEDPTPHVDWRSGGVRLPAKDVPWPRGERPRRAGVSSFGVGGIDAHVILEEAPAPTRPPMTEPDPPPGAAASGGNAAPPVLIWPLSARSTVALTAQARQLTDFVAARPALEPRDLSWSLAATRPALEHRAAVVGSGLDDLLAGLTALAAGRARIGTVTGTVSGTGGAAARLGFAFTGQGAQRIGMGQGLCAAHPAFADAFDAVCAALDEHLERPLAAVIRGETAADGGQPAVLDDTMWAQAALFAVEVALFRLLESWGLRPDAVAGHSIGELAAAHVAGVWSLPDAAAVVAARGRLMQALPRGGAMVAVATSEPAAEAVLERHPGAAIAAINGPEAVVLSGVEDAVTAAAAELAAAGARTHRLRVSHAFHSPLMEPMLAKFAEVTAAVSYRGPRIPMVSALTGRPVTDEVTAPDYWVRHVREPVRFADAVNALRAAGVRTFAEIGPDGVLSTMGPQTRPAPDAAAANATGTGTRTGTGDTDSDRGAGPRRAAPSGDELWLPVLRRGRDEARTLATAVARLHTRGVPVRWSAFHGTAVAPARRVDLPTYAFQRSRYWLTAITPRAGDRQVPVTEESAERSAGIFSALDQLEARLSAVDTDRDTADRIARRLREMLSGWVAARNLPEPESDGVSAEFGAATQDEVFAFLDKELGSS